MTETLTQAVATAETDIPATLRPMAQKARGAPVDFIVIGAMRAGTTTLHALLSRHPEIAMSCDKETDYFIAEKNWSRGPDWYRAQFDPARPIWGEASPNYAKGRDFAGVPDRIARHAPQVRLIYLVRDPVGRAVSQYNHSWNMGALATLPAALPGSHEYRSLIDISSYAQQLDLWRQHFPAEQMLIIDFDALMAEPQAQVDRILSHIGAAPLRIAGLATSNATSELSRVPRPLLKLAQGPLRPLLTALLGQRSREAIRRLLARGTPRKPPAFPQAVLAQMRAELADDAARFRAMTGLELPHWSV